MYLATQIGKSTKSVATVAKKFGRGDTTWMCECVPRKEGGIQVMTGLAPSSQTVGYLLRTPWPSKPAVKIL